MNVARDTNEPFSFHEANENNLAKIEPLLAIGGMPIPKLMDGGAGAKLRLRALASDAIEDDAVRLEVSQDGASRYEADIRHMNFVSVPCQLTIEYGSDGTFTGLGLDLSPLNKGVYHYDPDGTLKHYVDDEFKEVGRLRGRILSEQFHQYFIY